MDETPISIVREGLKDAMSPAAGMLIGFLFIINVFNHATSSSLGEGILRTMGAEVTTSGPLVIGALTWPPLGALALMAGFLASVVISIVIIRTLLQEDPAHIPETAYRDALIRPSYRLLLAGLLTGAAILIGALGPIVPALIASGARMPAMTLFLGIPGGIIGLVLLVRLLIGFLLVPVFIVDQDHGVRTAIRESWSLSRSHRRTLLIAGIVVLTVVLSISLVGQTLGGLVRIVSPTLDLLVRIAGMSVATVVQWATILSAYELLSTEG